MWKPMQLPSPGRQDDSASASPLIERQVTLKVEPHGDRP